MAADGIVEIKNASTLAAGINIFEGPGQTISPFRILDSNGNLLFDITPAGTTRTLGIAVPVRTLLATGPAAVTDGVILADATAGVMNVTLPAANSQGAGRGIQLMIVKIDASTNRVAIVPTAPDTLDGEVAAGSGLQLQNRWGGVRMISDGVNGWYTFDYLGGSRIQNFKTNVGAYTIKPADNRVLIDATAGAVAATLPAANAVAPGKAFGIKKSDVSANAVTITRAGADAIEGGTTIALAAQFNSAEVVSDGVSIWYKGATNHF